MLIIHSVVNMDVVILFVINVTDIQNMFYKQHGGQCCIYIYLYKCFSLLTHLSIACLLYLAALPAGVSVLLLMHNVTVPNDMRNQLIMAPHLINNMFPPEKTTTYITHCA